MLSDSYVKFLRRPVDLSVHLRKVEEIYPQFVISKSESLTREIVKLETIKL
jgi:hypothetical protein